MANSGAKLTNDPSWTGPLRAARKVTNKPFIVAFFLGLCVWIGITAYVFTSGDVDKTNDIFEASQESYMGRKWYLLAATLFTFCLSILFLVLLRVAPRKMAGISSVFNIVEFVLFIIGGIYMIYEIATSDDSTSDDLDVPVPAAAIYLFLPVAIVLLILSIRIKIRNSNLIPVSCEIVGEACKIILSFPSIIAYAVLNFILFYVLFILSPLHSLLIDVTKTFFDAENDRFPAHLGICMFFHSVASIWIIVFFFEMFRVIVAGTYGTWYWTENKREVPRFAVLRFVYIAIRYHIGPLAFGSLIMPFCSIPRFCVWLIASGFGIDCSSGSGNSVVRLFRRCCSCCNCSCYQVVKKFTGASFVQVALRGNAGFVDASRATFGLHQRNQTKVAAVGQIVLILYVAGMTIVMFFSGLLSSLIPTQSIDEENAKDLGYLLIFSGLMCFVIFKLLGIAVDTILMCGLEDFEMNGGRSRFMPDNLKNLLM
ncbi:choline transporter-like protein 2 [Trichogramma pretiosum]|uniref:choline transporter-like protein 2 n=1 Tax=Trichogramma pretiosum TaxID=7493 RepID=UPI000C71B45F|nr:choline transporter-like protein 2 [Trichogramma pretiosum]